MNDHADLIARLRDGVTLEGFGCACEPAFKCGACKARDTIRKAFGTSIEDAADTLEAQALDLAVCCNAIEECLDIVGALDCVTDADAACQRVTLRRLNEAIGKAAPRLLYERPEGQKLYGLNYKAQAAELERLRAALAAQPAEPPGDFWKMTDKEACSMLAAAAQPPAQPAADVVSYVARWGGNCRDCADENGVCPNSGLPCGGARKAIEHVLAALQYGVQHGYITDPLGRPPAQPPQAGDDARDEWQSVVFTLMGHASGLYASGQHDMPSWFYELAEKIARAHLDDEHAARVRAVGVQQKAMHAIDAAAKGQA